MKILVLGASGMLGSAIFRFLSQTTPLAVFGTTRSRSNFFDCKFSKNFIPDIDIENSESLIGVFNLVQPDVVINCVGLVKQLIAESDYEKVIRTNALFPHQLLKICGAHNSRLIHFSTDCVFSGIRGNYSEIDIPDASDIYGRSKLLGEIISNNVVTIRTSIIGHELSSCHSLVEWFLSQNNSVKGYKKAIFSGLPTVEVARVIRDYIIHNKKLSGLYHLSASPISKYDLLKEVAKVYGKEIDILSDDDLVIDRSLNSSNFCSKTGYVPGEWPDLIRAMYEFG